MKPIGPLMREHRLIERMVSLIEAEYRGEMKGNAPTPGFIEKAVDFFRIYADRTHHGKEEDILFKSLAEKPLTSELKKIMDELIGEHITARKLVGMLYDAGESYRQGNVEAVVTIKTTLKEIAALYPMHIEKEDKHFFYPILEYLSRDEQNAMLEAFWEFDRNMIHEKYRKAVEDLKG